MDEQELEAALINLQETYLAVQLAHPNHRKRTEWQQELKTETERILTAFNKLRHRAGDIYDPCEDDS